MYDLVKYNELKLERIHKFIMIKHLCKQFFLEKPITQTLTNSKTSKILVLKIKVKKITVSSL